MDLNLVTAVDQDWANDILCFLLKKRIQTRWRSWICASGGMRGQLARTGPLFSSISMEERIPKAHRRRGQLDFNLLFF